MLMKRFQLARQLVLNTRYQRCFVFCFEVLTLDYMEVSAWDIAYSRNYADHVFAGKQIPLKSTRPWRETPFLQRHCYRWNPCFGSSHLWLFWPAIRLNTGDILHPEKGMSTKQKLMPNYWKSSKAFFLKKSSRVAVASRMKPCNCSLVSTPIPLFTY